MYDAWQVTVFDADDVPHCAPTVISFAAVVSTVTVPVFAVFGIGRWLTAATPVPRSIQPYTFRVPVAPTERTVRYASMCHGTFVTPEPVVIAPDVTIAVPATPP